MDKNQSNLLKAYNMLLYFAGSMIMKEPSEECISDFWTKGILKKLPLKSSNPRFIKAASILRESCSDKKLCRNRLCEDFFRLFDKKGLLLAPACESAYLKINNDRMINSEPPGEFYSSYSWKPGSDIEVSDDHLGVELLFLTRLIEKFVDIDDDPCSREMKDEIRRFLDLHILSWIPGWNKDIQENAHTLCYKGIGNLIYACVEDIYIIISL